MSCAICEKRKEKRFCPVVHGRICPQCCGENREITFDCPIECVYLQQARQHERPRSLEELDRSTLFLDVEVGEQFLHEQEHLILGLSYAVATSAHKNPGIKDPDVIAALTTVTRRLETLVNSGLHYKIPDANPLHQLIAGEIENMIKEYRDTETKHLGYSRLKESDILRALVFLLRLALTRTSGRPKSRAFVDFMLAQFPGEGASRSGVREDSRLITP
ncbi:MAG: hypothetical protein M3O09_16430 [Acidobacteriota bacterium]|nr:hypothetical protein [Acidobacteriota bacterium]